MITHVKAKIAGAVILAISLGACAPMYRKEFLDQAEKKGWNREQSMAALYYSYRLKFLKKSDDGTYAVVYSVLPRETVITQLENTLRDLEDILDYKNAEWNQYMKEFGLRPYFLRQEYIIKSTLARLLADENDQKMKEMLGEAFAHGSNVPGTNLQGYNERVLTIMDLPKAYPYTSKVIEEAREAKLLKEVARGVKTDARELYQKESDPDDPTDPKKFIWVAKRLAYERVEYKVMVADEQPKDNKPNYIEIWRLNDGKRESSPAIKAFLDGSGGAIILVDTEKESEIIGFGLPNIVERVHDGLLWEDVAVISRIFPDARKDKRIEPKVPPIRVEIVRAGSPIDPWEVCVGPSGCPIPKSYRIQPTQSNYNIRVNLKAEKKPGSTQMNIALVHIAKEWTNGISEWSWSNAKVVEYYHAKSQCDNSDLLSAKVLYAENKKKVRFVCKDGTEIERIVTPFPNHVINDRPFQIDFTIGETRWRVFDSDGDGKFDKRRKISQTIRYDIGLYPDGAEVDSEHNKLNPNHLDRGSSEPSYPIVSPK
jgi:hypothetical protein